MRFGHAVQCAFWIAVLATSRSLAADNAQTIEHIVHGAFVATHDGWSSDEVLVNDDLNRAFLAKCHEADPEATDAQLNWALLNLRKSGRLKADVTRQRRDSHDEYRHAAEIAARLLCDRYQQNVDRILCEPKYRAEFDRLAASVAGDVKPYLLRKAALGLRKSRRLRPELVIRIADWGREILTLDATAIVANPAIVPSNPGIYIFRDDSGYLYVGESKNLRQRIKKHLDESDRKSLANYLTQDAKARSRTTVEIHSFDPDSKASLTPVRRAYESELIRSRRPRFNVQP